MTSIQPLEGKKTGCGQQGTQRGCSQACGRIERAGSPWTRRVLLAKQGKDTPGRGNGMGKAQRPVNEPYLERGGREGGETGPASAATPGHTGAGPTSRDLLCHLGRRALVSVVSPALMSAHLALSLKKFPPVLTSRLLCEVLGLRRPPPCLEHSSENTGLHAGAWRCLQGGRAPGSFPLTL